MCKFHLNVENEADNACMILVQLELSKATVEIPKIISNLAAVYLMSVVTAHISQVYILASTQHHIIHCYY